MKRKSKSKLTATIASYKARHAPYTERSDYRHYIDSLASELWLLKNESWSLECDSNHFIYYCYVYLNPLKPGKFRYVLPSGKVLKFDYEPFYVGKGKSFRYQDHLKAAKSSKANNQKLNTIRKILRANEEPIIKVTESRVSDYVACAFEIDMIAGVGRKNKKCGPLSNLTDGGESTVGYVHTPEWKDSQSKRSKGNKHAQGTVMSLANVERLRERMKDNDYAVGYKHTQEWKDANGIRSRGNQHAVGMKHTEDWKAAQSVRSKGNQYAVGYKHTQEWKDANGIRSRANAKKINYNGFSLSALDWSTKLGIKVCTIYRRVRDGWPVAKVLATSKGRCD